MIKAVGKGVGTGANGFLYKQIVILMDADTAAQYSVVGFVLVHIAQGMRHNPDERICPLDDLACVEQHDVE